MHATHIVAMALSQLGQQRLTSRLLQLPRSLWLVGGRPSDDRAFAISSSEDKVRFHHLHRLLQC